LILTGLLAGYRDGNPLEYDAVKRLAILSRTVSEVVLIFRSLKSNILINLVVLLSSGTVLLSVVAVIMHYRDVLRFEIAKVDLVLTALNESAFRSPQPDGSQAEPVAPLFEKAPIECALVTDRFGKPLLDRCPEGQLKRELQACIQSALKTGRRELCFSGQTWGVFWLQDQYMVVTHPHLKSGSVDGASGVATNLEGVYQTGRRSQKAFFIYGAINVAILAAIGVYRITKVYLEPLQRLAGRAEDYREEDTGLIFAVRKGDNELHQLSKSLNLMLERIAADKQKLRATVASLEIANTDLRKAQQEIIRAEKLASVGRLSAGIAHEIGNPIGIVMGYLHLLKQENGAIEEDEKREYIRRADDEISRINKIIRQLLDFSRPSSEGGAVIHVHEVITDISEVVRFEPMVANIDIRLKLDAENDRVTADPNQLRQVFLNLILNAADAIAVKSPNDEGCVTIRTTIKSHEGVLNDFLGTAAKPVLEIAVSDNGVGIMPENIADIFDPFFTTKEPGKGTGLGLSVSFMIVESLGGKISAVSKPGEGTTMRVSLPLYAHQPGKNDSSGAFNFMADSIRHPPSRH
jgi:two-component system, NtrC family, sensor kinase